MNSLAWPCEGPTITAPFLHFSSFVCPRLARPTDDKPSQRATFVLPFRRFVRFLSRRLLTFTDRIASRYCLKHPPWARSRTFRERGLGTLFSHPPRTHTRGATVFVSSASASAPRNHDRASGRRIMRNQPDVPLPEGIEDKREQWHTVEGPPQPPTPHHHQ